MKEMALKDNWNRYHVPIIIILGLLINFFLYQKFGVQIVSDSHRYIALPPIPSMEFGIDKNFWYVGYTFFVLAADSLLTSQLDVIIFQVIIYCISLIFIYFTSFKLFENTNTAFLTTLTYLAFLDITQWNFYILAESFYVSFVVIITYFILSFNRNVKSLFIIVPLILYCFFIKPTGFSILVAFATLVVSVFWEELTKKRLAFSIICLLIMTSGFFLLNKMLATFIESIIYNDYQYGELIYGIHHYPDIPTYNLLIIREDDLTFPSAEAAPLFRIAEFAIRNPFYFIKLFSAKAFYLLFQVRPYYSLPHNVYLLGILIPVYAGFIISVSKSRLPGRVILFALVFILTHTGIVCLTTVDWDGRFLLPMLPLIFIIGVPSLIELVKKIFHKETALKRL
jgi:hypothetical protein